MGPFRRVAAPLRQPVAGGPVGADGVLDEPDRLVCAAGQSRMWRKPLPGLALTHCTRTGLAVKGFDLASGRLAFSGDRAFFSGFGAADTAGYVTWLSGNLIAQLTMLALLTGIFIPWALKQFGAGKKEAPPAVAAKPAVARRRKKRAG